MATPQLIQKDRLLEVETPLGADVVINGFSGSESISGLFRFKLELLSPVSKRADVKSLLGKGVSVSLQTNGEPRYFHGIVNRISTGDRDKTFQHYTADVVPWLWLLTQRAGCRIFQDKTVPEILEAIFQEYNAYNDVVLYENLLNANYTALDYCVQYRETDFNFVSRLMEHEGIFYYFSHTEDSHTLELADSNTIFPDVPAKSTILYEAEGGYGQREDVITHWEGDYELRPTKYSLRDHHFELPGETLESVEGGDGPLEIYDYPGEYSYKFNKPELRLGNVNREGEKVVRIRMEEEELSANVFEGTSTCRNFVPGHKFKLSKHFMSDDEYVLTSVNYSASQSPDYISSADSTGSPYHSSFVCVKSSTPIRPKRLTPKPVVAGPQTATVTVKQGEESWLDKYGRVRLSFHWDREGDDDEKDSCWVRVAQPWAGGNWGAHFWPRVGQEVVVEFLEGDPDRPIITGSVYNKAQMPPYKLPDNYTRSGVITRSSKSGGSANFNELRFEDKMGAEQLFINAERDMDHRVENDSREFIGKDRHLIVTNDQVEQIQNDKHIHVQNNHQEKVDANMSLEVGANLKEKIGQDESLEVGANKMEKIGADLSLEVGSNRMEKIGSHHHLEVGSDSNEKIGSNYSLEVGSNRNEKVGSKYSLQVGTDHHHKVGTVYVVDAGQEVHIKGGMKVIIEAGMQISLVGPTGFVDIGPSGVTIQGVLVKINSGGSAGSGTSASPSSPNSPKSPKPPVAPDPPKDPDTADDGSKGDKLN